MSIFSSVDPEKLAEEVLGSIQSELRDIQSDLTGQIQNMGGAFQEVGGAVHSLEQRISNLESSLKPLAAGAEKVEQGFMDEVSKMEDFIKSESQYVSNLVQKLPQLSKVGGEIEDAILHVLNFENSQPEPREKLNRALDALEKTVGPPAQELGMSFVVSMIDEIRTVLGMLSDEVLAVLTYPLHLFDIDHFERVSQNYIQHYSSQKARSAGAAATHVSMRSGSYKSMIHKASASEDEGEKESGSKGEGSVWLREAIVIALNFCVDTFAAVNSTVPLQVNLKSDVSLGFVMEGAAGVNLGYLRIMSAIFQPLIVIFKLAINIIQGTIFSTIVGGENNIVNNLPPPDNSVPT